MIFPNSGVVMGCVDWGRGTTQRSGWQAIPQQNSLGLLLFTAATGDFSRPISRAKMEKTLWRPTIAAHFICIVASSHARPCTHERHCKDVRRLLQDVLEIVRINEDKLYWLSERSIASGIIVNSQSGRASQQRGCRISGSSWNRPWGCKGREHY